MPKTTNGGDEPIKDTTKEAVKTETVSEDAKIVESESEQTKEESKEKFDSSALLKEEPVEPKPTVSDEQRAKDKEIQQEKFNLALKFNLKKVEKMIDEEKTLEEALEAIPVHLRGHVKGIVNGETVEPKEEGSKVDPEEIAAKTYSKLRAQEKGEELFAQIVSENNLSKKDAEALASDVIRRKNLGHPLDEAVLDASARLGLNSKDAIKEAENKGLMRGLRALPPEGEPITKTDKKVTYTSEQADLARKCGNDPEKVYGGK